jgi:hypothetical protein
MKYYFFSFLFLPFNMVAQTPFSKTFADYHKRDFLEDKWIKEIRALKVGDKVALHWQHRYGDVYPNIFEPFRPIVNLEIIK